MPDHGINGLLTISLSFSGHSNIVTLLILHFIHRDYLYVSLHKKFARQIFTSSFASEENLIGEKILKFLIELARLARVDLRRSFFSARR